MSDPGPLPPPPRRPRWVWFLVGILGLCILICVGVTIWSQTPAGQQTINDLATMGAELQTATAEAGT